MEGYAVEPDLWWNEATEAFEHRDWVPGDEFLVSRTTSLADGMVQCTISTWDPVDGRYRSSNRLTPVKSLDVALEEARKTLRETKG